MVVFAEYPISWKIIMKPMTGKVVKSEVDVLMYAILSKAENRCLTGN
jgi:hypothetical protein